MLEFYQVWEIKKYEQYLQSYPQSDFIINSLFKIGLVFCWEYWRNVLEKKWGIDKITNIYSKVLRNL